MSRLAIALFGLALVAGCSNGPDPQAEMRAKAWSQIEADTDVVAIGDARMSVSTRAGLGNAGELLEINMLTRAAAEALRQGYPRFAIVHVDYDEANLTSLLAPSFGEPTTSWIGTYEALLAARAAGDPDNTLDSRLGRRKVTAVVRFLREDEALDRDSFSADETYRRLIVERIRRYNIRPTLRIGAVEDDGVTRRS